jgi:hypothetical protein
LKDTSGISVVSKAPQTAHFTIGSTKVSFIGYPYPVLFPLQRYENIDIADPRDIAAMKLSAIASRSTKRDFVDLYLLAQRYGLDELLRCFERKFSQLAFSDTHLLKSLTYFADADKDEMPAMLQPIDWTAIKQFFVTRTPRLKK